MNMDVVSSFSKQLGSMQVDRQLYTNDGQAVNLLSIEREQKLDLLIHLITNLQSPLIVQGSLGVGKTRLLSAVESRKTNSIDMLLLNLVWQASFESIQAQIVEFIKSTRQLECHSLAEALESYAQQELQLVLLIDDAAQLVSGLMGTLVDYASKYPVLRLVFALTPEEYKEKRKLEKIQASFHFVELPALNIGQCEAFIRSLVAQEVTAYTLKDINSSFVSEIYQATKGNPGKISAIIKLAKKRYFANTPVLVIMVVTVFICSALVSIFLWQEPEQEKSKFLSKPIQPVAEVIKQEPVMVVQQEIDNEVSSELLEAFKFPLEQQVLELPVTVSLSPLKEQVTPLIAEGSATTIDSVEKEAILSPISDKADEFKSGEILVNQANKSEVVKIEPEKKGEDSVLMLDAQDDRQWVLAQNSRQYTLQLMALSAKDKLLEEQEKYQRSGVKTFYLEKKGKQSKSYVLFYGVFASIDEATRQMQKLPKALQKSWPRRFSAIQKDL